MPPPSRTPTDTIADRIEHAATQAWRGLLSRNPRRRKAARRELEAWTPDPAWLETARRLLEASVDHRPLHDLPRTGGVYLVIDRPTKRRRKAPLECYVGISEAIASRFHRGHLSRGGTRAENVLGGRFEVWVSTEANDLGRAEIRLYLLARAAGLHPVNQIGSLGRSSDPTALPIVSCRLSDGQLLVHDGREQAITDLELPIGSTGISAAIAGHQRTVAGYAFRLAQPTEIERWRPTRRTSDARMIERKNGRGLSWTQGGVPARVRQALSKRATTYQRRSTGALPGVTLELRTERWLFRYCDPASTGGMQRISIGQTFATAEEAEVAARAFVAANPHLARHNPAWGRWPDR